MKLSQAASVAFLAFLCGFLAKPNCGVEAIQCSTPESDPVRVSLASRHNQTGHWVSEVVMHHDSAKRQVKSGSSEAGTWAVDVEPSAIRCGRFDSALALKLTFTSSPAKPADYELFPGIGYFKFHLKPQQWAKAREICEREWAHLAIVNSDKEADVIAKQLFGRFPKIEGAAHQDWVWIGLEKDVTTGGWVTVFGDPLNATGFTTWDTGRPQPRGGDCGLIRRNSGALHDNPCSVVAAFVCEHDL